MEARIRRRSDPVVCQYLWDAIATIRNHKQLPSFDRIRRYMNRTHSMESDKVEKHLEECTADNLITVSRKVGQKGSKVGVEQEGFRLPTPPEEPEGHDWYCFECHQGGEVLSCTKCYRVFHNRCLSSQEYQYPQEMFVCPVCQKRLFQRTGGRCRIARDELNALLTYTVSKLKERLPVNLMERVVTSPAQKNNFTGERVQSPRQEQTPATVSVAEPWRAQLLLHHQMDLHTMEQKSQDRRYKTPYDFENDATTVAHNAVIFHGVQSQIAEMGLQMLRDCQHDLSELEQCTDCYRFAQDKNDRFWFCKPCNPPHELVYVKQKGFPIWPAKVIKIENETYEVRFFGSQHQRASVEKANVKPISVNVNQTQSKKTSAWTKACEELEKHQEMIELPRHVPPPPPPPPTINHQMSSPFTHPYHHIAPHPPPVHASTHESQRFFAQPFPPHFQGPQHCFPHHQPPLIHPWGAAVQASMSPRPLVSALVPRPPTALHPSQLTPPTLVPTMPPPQLPATQSTPQLNKETTEQSSKPPRNVCKKEEPSKESTSSNGNSTTTTTSTTVTTTTTTTATTSSAPKEVRAPKLITAPQTTEADQGPSSSSSLTVPCNKETAPDDMVSSSSQEHPTENVGVQTSPRLLKIYVEELAETTKSKEVAKEVEQKNDDDSEKTKTHSTIRQLEKDMKKSKEEYKTKLSSLQEKQKRDVSDTKRKQWCWTCENEAIYHCCWNTAYCSIECQQKHWKSEHKKMCRRKR